MVWRRIPSKAGGSSTTNDSLNCCLVSIVISFGIAFSILSFVQYAETSIVDVNSLKQQLIRAI